MNQQLIARIREEIATSRAEGLDAEDIFWMACGAGLDEARNQGVVEEASPEMLAAIEAVVKGELAARQ